MLTLGRACLSLGLVLALYGAVASVDAVKLEYTSAPESTTATPSATANRILRLRCWSISPGSLA